MTSEQYETAYTTGYRQTVGYLVNRGIDHESAEDYAQQGWLNTWQKCESVRHETAARYACVAAYNVAKNVWKKYDPSVPVEDEFLENLSGDEPDTRHLDIRTALAATRPADSTLVGDYFLLGYTAEELAERYGCARSAIRMRLFYATAYIRQALARKKKVNKVCNEC